MADNNNINNNETSEETTEQLSSVPKEKSIETKLGELMMQGWTMLNESCFMESCSTPLMRDNVTKQVYCVGCEAWVFSQERKAHKCKFTELVSLEGKRNLSVIQNGEVSKLSKPLHLGGNSFGFREILENKLMTLAKWLQSETDINKCNATLEAIEKTMKLLKDIPKSV
jgi:uncharacterized Zn finger protein (UPF0148 family)